MIESLRYYRIKLFLPVLLSSVLFFFISEAEATSSLYSQDNENLQFDCINQKIHYADFLELSENSVEKFLQEKLLELSGNLVFKPTDFVGSGFESEVLSREVLEAFYDVAKHHHQGQMRKGTIPTSYMAHVLGVAAILVNQLDIKNPQAILAAILHDVIEDSVEYYLDCHELKGKIDLVKIRKEREQNIKVTKKMQEQKAVQIKDDLQKKLLEKGLSQDQIELIDLEKVLQYVLAMTKQKNGNLLNDYFLGLVLQGSGAVAIKMADRMYNIGDLKYVSNEQFAQGYIYGRPNDPGTVIEFIEFKYDGDAGKRSFIDQVSIPTEAQLQFKSAVLNAVLESYKLGRITQFNNVDGAIMEVKRIDDSVDFTGMKFDTPEDVFEYALRSKVSSKGVKSGHPLGTSLSRKKQYPRLFL